MRDRPLGQGFRESAFSTLMGHHTVVLAYAKKKCNIRVPPEIRRALVDARGATATYRRCISTARRHRIVPTGTLNRTRPSSLSGRIQSGFAR